jgi:DNA-binding winged helix-turn-helix (wHTH) protein/tetratricopeptide (TPR) repeat protein
MLHGTKVRLRLEDGKESVPTAMMDGDRRLTFDAYRLDLANERLLCEDEVVGLTPKAFAVLRCLIERRGQLVKKEELLGAGWADTHVTDAVLKVSILEIRRALGDDAAAPRFIETVPRRGYRFIAALGRASAARVAAAPSRDLVGRNALLAQLEDRLERARTGQRQLVFLSGEAGIGKTSVLDAFLAHAAADPDLWIARGECLEHYGAAEAYLPVLDALGRLLREPGGTRALPFLESHAPTWLVQLPWLRGGDQDAARRDLLGATKERMLREMAEALEALTVETPLVLVLEDLHWSDYSTLDLLGTLGRRHEPARLLVLGSYRPVDVIVAEHPLRGLTQELRVRRQCEDIALEFLRDADVAAYLTHRFGGHAFPPELTGAVHRQTDGNPLFMVRLVDELVTLGVLADQDGRWRLLAPLDEIARAVPESLRQLIDKQISRLEPDVQRLLEVASVLGHEFTARSLAAGLDEDPLTVEERCDALAQQGQLVAPTGLFVLPDGTAIARYRFTHSLYPQVLAERVAAGRRLRLHQRLGEWLERTYGAHAGMIGSQLARHFEAARDYRRAITYLRRAADGDASRWGNQEAAARLTHALTLAGRLPPTDADAVYPTLLEQLGRVRRGIGDVQGAVQAFESLTAWGRDRGQLGWEAKAALYRASVLSWVDPERSRTASAEGIALGERVEDPLLRAHLQGYSAYWQLQRHGWRADDARMAEHAVAAARAAGDRELLSESTGRLAAFQRSRSDFRLAIGTATEGLALAREVGNAYDYLSCQYFRAQAFQHLGEWGTALTAIDDGLRMAAQSGHAPWGSLLRLEAASLHTEALDFAGAAAITREELRGRSLTPAGGQRAMIELAFALLGLGELDEAYAAFTAPQLLVPAGIETMAWSGQVLLRHGLGQLWLARGKADRAQREAEALHALVAAAADPMPRASAARLLAEIALHRGRLSEAEAFLGDAFAAIEGYEVPVVEWRIAASAARVHGRQRRRTEAEAARMRSVVLVSRLADSLPPDHELRGSFLGHRSVREVLGPGATARTRADAPDAPRRH